MTEAPVSAERIRELFEYDPESGQLTRKPCHQNKWLPSKISAKNTYGYLVASVDGRALKAHRIIWALAYGAWPANDIDHINRVRDDNRLVNLRQADKTLNVENRESAGSYVATDTPRAKPHRARIRSKGTTLDLGYFATEEEARAAYVAAKRRLHAGCTI